MGTLADFRFALRTLAKSPGFAVLTILTLALGIGANTAIFSLVNGVLLKPLPYSEGSRLVVLQQSAPKADVANLPFSIREVYDYRDANRTLSGLVEHHSMSFTLLGRSEPERVSTGVVSAEFFDVLGVDPLLGRSFRTEDDDLGAEPVLMLSYGYWQRSFGGDPGIVGRAFEMNDRSHTVIGVLPPIPQFPIEHDVYMPTSACPFRAEGERRMSENRSAFRAMTVFGRLVKGTSLDQARADLSGLAARFAREYPETYPPESGYAITITPLQEALTVGARPTLLLLLATSSLVLIIACANVANLAVARLLSRDREMAVRTSLGAARARLVRQALAESLLLSIGGGTLGLLFAFHGLDLLVAFIARFTPRAADTAVDGSVLLFTLLVSLLTGVAIGLLPVFSNRQNLSTALRDGAHTTEHRNRHRLRAILIAAQVAVTVVLLVEAGLMLRSLGRLRQVDPGFRTQQVLMARLSSNWSRYRNQEDAHRFFDTLLQRVRALPGVVKAAVASGRPLEGQPPFTVGFRIENIELRDGELQPQVARRVASPDYFETMGIPLIQGRSFTPLDHSAAPKVAIVNHSLANQYWRASNPVGQRVSLDDGQSFLTIVGVVGDVRLQELETVPVGALYLPVAQSGWATTLVVRTPDDPTRLSREIKEVVHAIDPEQPVDQFETIEQTRYASMASPRLTALLLGLFAFAALAISATGIGGLVAYSVSQRTHEIGIRMALGARRGQVLSMILRQGLGIVSSGLALGLLLAIATGRAFESLLFETSPWDPVTFLGVMLVLVLASATASFLPARRATEVDPNDALRTE